ncbi:hypothetical protein EOL70_06945 [Leucothrix sargassi]|nr:hypothetical protein EOL70_06945 [Leucothrix sargassi]
MLKQLKLWYRGGRYVNGEVVYQLPHWSARLVRRTVDFVSLEWKWLLAFLCLIIAIVVISI